MPVSHTNSIDKFGITSLLARQHSEKQMAYYIIFFNNHGEVIDVVRYSIEEYEGYLKHLERLKTDNSRIQYGYF